jgi:hypothetical protein
LRERIWILEAELQGLDDRVWRRLLENDSVDTIAHNFTTESRRDHWQSMRLRLQLRQGESTRKGRQNEDIRFSK